MSTYPEHSLKHPTTHRTDSLQQGATWLEVETQLGCSSTGLSPQLSRGQPGLHKEFEVRIGNFVRSCLKGWGWLHQQAGEMAQQLGPWQPCQEDGKHLLL